MFNISQRIEYLNSLLSQTRGQTLGKLVRLFRIRHHQSVQESRASDLELGLLVALANFYKLGICATRLLKEITNISNLLGHGIVPVESSRGREMLADGWMVFGRDKEKELRPI